jgi:hypothetical protein
MDHKDGYECVETRKLSLALLKEEESLSINPFKAGLSFNCEKSFIPTQGGFLPVLCFYIAEIQVYLLSCDEETKELSLCLAEDYYDNQGRSVFSTSSIVRDLWSWSTDLTIKAFCLFNRSAINTVDGVHFVWTSYVNPPPRGWFKRPH